jgi:hypothetical protein
MRVTSVQSISYRSEWRGGGQATLEPGELRRGPSNAGCCPRPVGGIHSEPRTGKILCLQIHKMKEQQACRTASRRRRATDSCK